MADEAQKFYRKPVISPPKYISFHLSQHYSSPPLPHLLFNLSPSPREPPSWFNTLSAWVSGPVQLIILTKHAWDGAVHHIYTRDHRGLVGTEEPVWPRGLFPPVAGSCPDKPAGVAFCKTSLSLRQTMQYLHAFH